MSKTNTGVSVDAEVLEAFDAILDAMEEESDYGVRPSRSQVVESLMAEWVEEHRDLLEADTGNPQPTAAALS